MVREEQRRGDDSGLSDAEIIFHDAYAEKAFAREVMVSDDLRLIARKLTERFSFAVSVR